MLKRGFTAQKLPPISQSSSWARRSSHLGVKAAVRLPTSCSRETYITNVRCFSSRPFDKKFSSVKNCDDQVFFAGRQTWPRGN